MQRENSRSFEHLAAGIGHRYTITGEIGTGGMGTVYSAIDARYGRQVAIKVMHEALAGAVVAERFLREIAIAARLQHPHILPLFDSGEKGGILFYVMPLVSGESLRERMDRERQLPLADVCRLARQVAGALDYAHANGIVHRDVKPQNILLSRDQAILADFGIAKIAAEASGGSLTTTGLTIGTPLYMSPEQSLAQRDLDGRGDQYSLACVVYEMLTGEPPFSGASPQVLIARHLHDRPASIRTARASVPPRMELAVSAALSKVPADRFPTALAFAEALEVSLHDANRTSAPQRDPALPFESYDRRPNAGRLVSKTCDRWTQVNAFDDQLRSHWRRHPGRPHVFVVSGEEGQGHGSLLQRLCETTVVRFANDTVGVEHASIMHIHAPWPETDDLLAAQRGLAVSLFREADPGYMGDDLGATALLQQVARQLTGVAVVHHDIRTRRWTDRTADLIRWYVSEFWGNAIGRRGDPQALVFLNLIYPSPPPRRLIPLPLSTERRRRARIAEAIARMSSSPTRCGWTVFQELQSVSADDVKDWLSKNNLFESEQQRELRADALFQPGERRRMADIEPALVEIHEAALNEQSLRAVMA